MTIKIGSFQAALTPEIEFKKIGQQLEDHIHNLKAMMNYGYETPFGFLAAINDDFLLHEVQKLAQKKLSLNPALLVIVGIGGSNLGTFAAIQALYGVYYNDYLKLKVLFVDTVDSFAMHDMLEQIESVLKKGEIVLVNIISKSGTTTETIANAQVLVTLLMQYRPHDYNNHIIITTDKGTCLEDLAHLHRYALLSIPSMIGGRFSVFSAVGLFPLAMLGVDVIEMRTGASDAIQFCIGQFSENICAQMAAIVFYHYKQGIKILDTFVYALQLEAYGKWFRQLVAESLGKEYDMHGQKVHAGILPTVSVGTIDLHSVAQLYLAGPNNRLTCFLSVESEPDVVLPEVSTFSSCVQHLNKKSLADIMRAIIQGVKDVYQEKHLPYYSIVLPSLSAYTIGQLMVLNMIQTVYLGNLLNIDVFDQPHVELYKRKTRKILAHE